MPVVDYFKDKTLLITGTTGFVGKVLLEKILFVASHVERIYVLIRNKKGTDVLERFKAEVMNSMCFERLRRKHKDFENFFLQKVVPVRGDLLEDGLSLSKEDEERLTREVHIVINSAASVDFNARLDEAINANIIGSLRVYSLAKRMVRLENFIHISTSYVNSNRDGVIEERIYYDQDKEDPQVILNRLLSMSVDQLVSITSTLLGNYPNTYTYTKSITEKILAKDKGLYPITIVRPSIIGSSWREPFPGWVDTVSAAGALYLLAALGIVTYAEGNGDLIGDQIPVDLVVDLILTACAYTAGKKDFFIFQSGSSDKNPITLNQAHCYIYNYWARNPSEKQITKTLQFNLTQNKYLLTYLLIKRRIPALVFFHAAKLSGNEQTKKNASRYRKVVAKGEEVAQTFRHFITHEWIFTTKNSDHFAAFLSENDRSLFNLDVAGIKWREYLSLFAWGLHRFVLKEDAEPPMLSSGKKDIFTNRLEPTDFFNDVNWSLVHGNFSKKLSPAVLVHQILSSEAVRALTKGDQLQEEKAKQMCRIMVADYQVNVMRVFAWGLHKIFRKIFEKIVIDETKITKLKELEGKGPLILTPNHISYMDFLILSYIFYAYGLKVPYVSSTEDFLGITFINRILRASGAFFVKKKFPESNKLYRAILGEYLKELLVNDSNIEIFIETSRTRSGKLTTPKNEVLDVFANLYENNKMPLGDKDVNIVPVCFSYERVLEGETFPLELLGEEKVKESLVRIMRAVNVINKSLGKIFVEICEPISMKSFTRAKPQGLEGIRTVDLLKRNIISQLNANTVITPPAIAAAVILMHRKGISEEQLVSKIECLIKEISKRNKKIGTMSPETPIFLSARSAIKLLQSSLNKFKNMFQISISVKQKYSNYLLLAYYRNSLMGILFDEARVACSIASFGIRQSLSEGVPRKELSERAGFLKNLLHREYFSTYDETDDPIERMVRLETLNMEENLVIVKNDFIFKFLCSLIWPYIESYWVVAVFLLSMKKDETKAAPNAKVLQRQIQWFAETLYSEKNVEFYESCSLDTIKHALKTYRDMDIIIKNRSTKTILLKSSQDKILDLVNRILIFKKNSFIKSMASFLEIAQKSWLVDYLLLTKI